MRLFQLVTQPIHVSILAIQWIPPENDFYKLNVDVVAEDRQSCGF